MPKIVEMRVKNLPETSCNEGRRSAPTSIVTLAESIIHDHKGSALTMLSILEEALSKHSSVASVEDHVSSDTSKYFSLDVILRNGNTYNIKVT